MKHLEPIQSVEEIFPGIIRILGQNPGNFTLQGTNTYLIGSKKNRILVDTGIGESSYLDLLHSVLESKDAQITDIIITHNHSDHIGGLESIIAKNKPKNLWLVDPDHYRITEKNFSFPINKCKVTKSTKIILSDDFLEIFAIPTPGHTKDHCSFWLPHVKVIISGDCILGQEFSPVFEDLQTFLASLSSLLWFMQRHFCTIILPGHGPLIKDGPAKIKSMIEHRMKRHEQIYKILLEKQIPMSSEHLMNILYDDHDDAVKKAAEHLIKLHLELLESDGMIKRNSNGLYCSLHVKSKI